MSWDFNRHTVAKKVLAKHMDELDRKQARISARRDENMRDLQRELISLHSLSTPDLGPGTGSPRSPRKLLPGLSRSTAHSLTFGNGGAPTYSMAADTKQLGSRLRSRRQSEPVAMIGRDLGDIHRLMNKAMSLADEAPNENWNSLLESTLPGDKKNSYSRLQQRRGTIAQTEGLDLQKISTENSVLSATMNQTISKNIPRRGSLPINSLDLKTVAEKVKVPSARSKKAADDDRKKKKENVSVFPKRIKSGQAFNDQNGINVSFYSEDTGEESVPVVPQLNLYDADESSAEEDSNSDNADNKNLWKDVAKCRYIRGHNPPEMISPEEDTATFVFGRTYNDGFQAQHEKV